MRNNFYECIVKFVKLKMVYYYAVRVGKCPGIYNNWQVLPMYLFMTTTHTYYLFPVSCTLSRYATILIEALNM